MADGHVTVSIAKKLLTIIIIVTGEILKSVGGSKLNDSPACYCC